MLGVRRRGLASAGSFLAFAVCFLLIASGSGAVELGNMLFPPAANPSREASALALSAISDAIQAFEKRELNDPQASQELIARSRGKLIRAADKMNTILKDSNAQLRQYLETSVDIGKQLSPEDAVYYDSWAREAGVKYVAKDVNNRREVFQVFVTQTYRLAGSLEAPQTDPDFFRRITDQISNYFKGGDITTRLLR